MRRLGRRHRTIDQRVGRGVHEPQVAIFDDVAGQHQAAGGLVHAQDGADQPERTAVFAEHLERKQQARSRQAFGVLAQVPFVDVQRGLSVELKQHVAGATRDFSHRTEGLPAVEGAVADAKLRTRESDRHDLPLGQPPVRQGPGPLEGAAITRQPAGQQHARPQALGQPFDQSAAVDLHTLSQQQHMHQIRRGQRQTQPLAGGPRILHAGQIRHRDAHSRTAESQGVNDELPIRNTPRTDLARGGAAGQFGPGKGVLEGLEQAGRGHPLHRAEDQHQLRCDRRQRRQIGGQWRPADSNLTNFHDVSL